MTRYDFSALETAAHRLLEAGRHRDALVIYFAMAEGDTSLDAGHLAERIATCYRALGDLHAARYWYGRAIEENPTIYGGCRMIVDEMGEGDLDRLLNQQD